MDCVIFYRTKLYWLFPLHFNPGYLFTDFSFYELGFFSTPEFVGMKNFTKMIHDDTFWISLKQTFIYTIGVVPLTLICSLGLAILLNRKIRGMKFLERLFFPYVTSLVAIAVVWNMLFHPTMGPINQF